MPVYELPEKHAPEFAELDSFTQGYIEAMFFTNQSCIPMCEFHTDESQEMIREGQADGDLPQDAGFLDLHPDALESIQSDCVAFQKECAPWLAQAYEGSYDAERAGNDFWYSRNGHGCGYWDREELDGFISKCLDTAAEKFGEVNPWFSETPDDSSPTGYGFVYDSM